MTIRDLIDELIQIEAETSQDEEVAVNVTNIPGIGEVYGCHIEGLSTDGSNWSLQAVAP